MCTERKTPSPPIWQMVSEHMGHVKEILCSYQETLLSVLAAAEPFSRLAPFPVETQKKYLPFAAFAPSSIDKTAMDFVIIPSLIWSLKMKILVSDITEEGLDLEFEETVRSESLSLLSPVRAALRVDKFGAEVLAKGEVKTRVELQCSRCLKSFPQDMDVMVNVVYHPAEELKGDERHEIKDDELDLGFYQGDELDVDDLVMEQILLNVPMKPLCSDACKGICPKCGADLNAKACNCEHREPDPRLEVLKKLLERKE